MAGVNNHVVPLSLSCLVCLTLFLLLPSLAQAGSLQQNPSTAAAPTAGQAGQPQVSKIGGGVSPPVLIYSSEPKLSKNTRKLDGSVLVSCYVEPDGRTSNVHATRTTVKEVHLPIDEKELEESAIRAVQSYRFKPSSKNGQPVRVQLNIEVNFTSR